jgi:hypothetical protein
MRRKLESSQIDVGDAEGLNSYQDLRNINERAIDVWGGYRKYCEYFEVTPDYFLRVS